jgi:hypothetical protein
MSVTPSTMTVSVRHLRPAAQGTNRTCQSVLQVTA